MLNLLPISDANPTRRTPYVTLALIVVNVIAFFFVEPGFGESAAAQKYFFENAPLPCQASQAFDIGDASECPVGDFSSQIGNLTIPERGVLSLLGAILLSTFLHGGFLHIGGNMLFLWIFGNNVEDYLGRFKYLMFYLVGGIAAAFAHIFANLSDAIPAIGASGAVAAVMGAYLVLYPRARVNVLFIFFLITFVQMSAYIVLGLWFLLQFYVSSTDPSVAAMAHIGGFVFGIIGVFLLGGRPHPPAYQPWGGPGRSRRFPGL